MSDNPVVGDFDGDGQDDVMAYRPGGTDNDPVWWGSDRSDFGGSTDTFSVAGTYTPLSGDFNGDGYGDIFWYKYNTALGNAVFFWFGRYDGSYDGYSHSTPTATDYTPFTGDFDGDGYSDIYWYRAGSGNDWIWFGDSGADEDNHTYAQDSENVSGTYLPVAGDFDGDGKDEIFWYGPGATADSLWNFTSRTSHTSSTRTVSGSNFIPVAGDFDGDHKADILFNNWTTDGGDTIWWGDTVDGSSQKYVSLAIARLPFAGDFDGDGKSDLFVNRYSAGGDTIWWGAAKTDFGTNSDDIGFEASSTTLDATYSYGIDGMRSAKTVNSGTEQQFTWNDANGLPTLLAETQGSDTTYLIYGPGDQPIEQVDPAGTAQWLHHDQLGSVRLTTHATDGTHASDRRFNAYGTTADANGTQPLLDYASQYTDTETGYQFLRARYYDPNTGQFLTRDPEIRSTHDSYSYARSNPAGLSDPLGLFRLPFKVPTWVPFAGGADCVAIDDPDCDNSQTTENAAQFMAGAANALTVGHGKQALDATAKVLPFGTDHPNSYVDTSSGYYLGGNDFGTIVTSTIALADPGLLRNVIFPIKMANLFNACTVGSSCVQTFMSELPGFITSGISEYAPWAWMQRIAPFGPIALTWLKASSSAAAASGC